jgi:hypothetical protein
MQASINSILSGKHTLEELAVILDKLPQLKDASVIAAAPVTLPTIADLNPKDGALTLSVQGSFDLESPKFTTADAGIFSSTLQLSFDVDNDKEEDVYSHLTGSHSADIVAILPDFEQHFVTLKTKWTHTLMEEDTSHTIMISDLKAVNDHITLVKHKLGFLSDAFTSSDSHSVAQLYQIFTELQWISTECLTTTTNVQLVQQAHASLCDTFNSTHEEQELQIHILQSALLGLETKMNTVDRCLKEFEKHFTIIFPIIRDFRQQWPIEDHASMDRLKRQIQDLSDKVESLDQVAWQQINAALSPTSVSQPITCEPDLQDLHHQLKVLQHSIVGGGVKIGSTIY